MPSTLVLAAVLLVAGQTASASSVDLAEIQGTVVPGGKEVRGVVEPGALVPHRDVGRCTQRQRVKLRMHAQAGRHGSLWTPERVWAMLSRQRSGGATDRSRACQLHIDAILSTPYLDRAFANITACCLHRGADEPQDALDDTYLRLYDTDGETVLDANDDELVGKESLIHWMCPKTGCDTLGNH